MTAAPSDLLPLPPRTRRRRVAVGGRIASVDGTRLTLSDALGSVVAQLAAAAPPRLEPGDLLVLSGRIGPQGLTDARVVEHRSAPLPQPGGEVAHFAWGEVGRALAARSRALGTVRRYFSDERFVEVDTPLRVRTPCLDTNVDAVKARGGWLVTSPELHMKRLLVGGLPRIFQLCHCSREEELGPWHEPEFMMLEWYRAFADVEEVMADTEQIVGRVVEELAGSARIRSPRDGYLDVRPPFDRITVRGAFQRYAGVRDAAALARNQVDEYFRLLVDRVEPALAQRRRPVFLTEYPITEAALARPHPTDPTVAERFELYAGGIELCNGFGELTDVQEQRRRFVAERAHRRQMKQPVYPLDHRFLAGLHEGMPPSAGNALGIDRLIALALELPGIALVQSFSASRR